MKKLAATTETLFAVARDKEIISDGYESLELARRQRTHLEEQLAAINLTDDLRIVSVEIRTTIGRPSHIPDPEPEPVDVGQSPEASGEPEAK